MTSTFVVIAAYNEADNIAPVIRESKQYCDNIVVVDDGSKDSTKQVAEEAGALVLRHLINLGKGAATRTGIEYAISKGADTIILLDGDGQHRPADIPRFLEHLQTCDIVFGYRAFNKKMPFVFRLGNTGINIITTILFGLRLRDTQSGYRAFKAQHYPSIKWRSNDYSMESEMIANIGRARLRYAQIPIKTIYHNNSKGTSVKDGLKIGLNMLLWRLRSLWY